MANSMRGLTVFIGDIRNCKTKEAEQKRIDKELAHIRDQFTNKNLEGYHKKKYVWKLLYIHLLGYDVEVGHMEALQLIAAPKFTEKQAGYMACSVLLNENHPLLRMIIQSAKNDLASPNEYNQCLALACVANVGGQEFAESLAGDVQRILFNSQGRPFVRKKAALCLLRLFRKFPDIVPSDFKEAHRVVALLDELSLGALLCVSTLILGLVSRSTKGYEEVVDKAIRSLNMLSFQKDRFPEYRYYHTLCPWLQVKLLRILQYFPPPADKGQMTRLNEVLVKILTKTEVTKSVNKNNADHGILFEAVNLVINYCYHGVTELQDKALALLGRFISVKEPNIRYLGLETMSRLGRVPGSLAALKPHLSAVQFSLKDPDVSIRKRALDVLFVMCDHSNAIQIVDELIKQLNDADYQFKEELVLKIAILAEKYAQDLRWYIDIILKLINLAGDFVSEDIWYRVVQIVTNNEELQEYAATTCYDALKQPSIHENGVKVGGYILGEFGNLIKGDDHVGDEIVEVLSKRFTTVSAPTKALLLNAFIKLSNTYPQVKDKVDGIFQHYVTSADAELQQRALEYKTLHERNDQGLLDNVFDVMPVFPERESALLKRIKKVANASADRAAWADGKDGADGKKEEESEEDEDEKGKQEEDDEDDEDEQEPQHDGSDNEDDRSQKGKSAVPQDILGAFAVANDAAFAANAFAADVGTSAAQSLPAQDAEALTKLVGRTSGVLYESPLLQIGVKVAPPSASQPTSQCRMIFYYGNKTDEPLTNLRLELPNYEGLKAQLKPAEPLQVPAGKQEPHYLLWQCFKPFREAPTVTLTFNHAGADQSVVLKIPVVITQFITPLPQDQPDFIASWKNNANQDIKVVQGSQVIDIGTMKQMVNEHLHMAVIDGVEKDENNFSACGVFVSATKNAQGEFVSMPCLLRFETKPASKFTRVTARAGHKSLCPALLYAVSTLVGANPDA